MRNYLTLSLFVFLVSCNKSEERMEIAKHKVTQYYTWLSAGKIDSIFSLFPTKLFAEKDSIKVVEQLEELHELGQVVSYKLVRSTIDYRRHEGKKVVTLTLKYRTTYSDSSISSEQFKFMTVKEDHYFDKLIKVNLNAEDE